MCILLCSNIVAIYVVSHNQHSNNSIVLMQSHCQHYSSNLVETLNAVDNEHTVL